LSHIIDLNIQWQLALSYGFAFTGKSGMSNSFAWLMNQCVDQNMGGKRGSSNSVTETCHLLIDVEELGTLVHWAAEFFSLLDHISMQNEQYNSSTSPRLLPKLMSLFEQHNLDGGMTFSSQNQLENPLFCQYFHTNPDDN
jgi:hypothetical protein